MTSYIMSTREDLWVREADLAWTVLHDLDELNRVEAQLEEEEALLEDLYFEKDRLERLRAFACRRHQHALGDVANRRNWGEIEAFVPCTMEVGAWQVGFYLTDSILERMRAELSLHQNAEKFWRQVHGVIDRRLQSVLSQIPHVEAFVRNLTRALCIREENLEQSDALYIEASFDLSIGTIEENLETERMLESALRRALVAKLKPGNLRNVGGPSWKLNRASQTRAMA